MQVLKSRFDLDFPHLIKEFLIDDLALLRASAIHERLLELRSGYTYTNYKVNR